MAAVPTAMTWGWGRPLLIRLLPGTEERIRIRLVWTVALIYVGMMTLLTWQGCADSRCCARTRRRAHRSMH